MQLPLVRQARAVPLPWRAVRTPTPQTGPVVWLVLPAVPEKARGLVARLRSWVVLHPEPGMVGLSPLLAVPQLVALLVRVVLL